MSTKNTDREDLQLARRRVDISPGESVQAVRKLQNLSLRQLAEITGIPQMTLRAIESGRLALDVDQTKLLAQALRVHPAVLLFPGWEIEAA